VQIGELVLKLDQRVVGACDVAGTAGASADASFRNRALVRSIGGRYWNRFEFLFEFLALGVFGGCAASTLRSGP